MTTLRTILILLAAATLVAAACARAAAQEAGDGQAKAPMSQKIQMIQEHEFFQLPPDAVLAWAMNPGPLGARPEQPAGAAMSDSLMRLAVASGMLPEGPAGEAAAGALIASALGSTPHRIILLDVTGDTGEQGEGEEGGDVEGAGLRITSLALVVEIWTGADHTPLRNTVRAALVDYDARAGEGAQRVIELPRGGQAMAYTRPDWPAWREIAWYSEEGRFIVTIGAGAMARWLEQRERQYLHNPWDMHRRPAIDWLQEARGAAQPAQPPRVMELAADLDRFRRGFPEAIGGGLAGQFLRAWGLSNARSFMLHGRLVPAPAAGGEHAAPPMLALSATWGSRAERPEQIHHKPVAAPAWPAAFGEPPSDARWACALMVNWPAALSRALGTWGASMDLEERRRWGPGIQQWLRRHGPQLSQVVSRMDAAAAVIGPVAPADGWPPSPGSLVVAPAREGVEAEALEAEIRALMRLVRHVRYDDQTRTWAVGLLPERLDPTGSLGQLAWGVGQWGGRPAILAAAGSEARRQVDEARQGP